MKLPRPYALVRRNRKGAGGDRAGKPPAPCPYIPGFGCEGDTGAHSPRRQRMLCHLWPVGRVPTCIWRCPLSQELSVTVRAGVSGPDEHPARNIAASTMVVMVFMVFPLSGSGTRHAAGCRRQSRRVDAVGTASRDPACRADGRLLGLGLRLSLAGGLCGCCSLAV